MADEGPAPKRGRPKKRGTAYKRLTVRLTVPEYNFVESMRKRVQRTKPRGTRVTQRSLILEALQIIGDAIERAEKAESTQKAAGSGQEHNDGSTTNTASERGIE